MIKKIGIFVALGLVIFGLGVYTGFFGKSENTETPTYELTNGDGFMNESDIEMMGGDGNVSMGMPIINNQTQEMIITNEMSEGAIKALVKTTKGDIEITFDNRAPKAVENFITLAEQGFYNGIKFHRVIENFMIQGGDPLTKDDTMSDYWGTGGPGYQFEDEIHEGNHNGIGSISMANSGPHTNGSQFFMNTADNGYLDTKHTVFGNVTAGMDVVSAIESVDTFPNDRPIEPVEIISVQIIK